jgi:hypothetical protein
MLRCSLALLTFMSLLVPAGVLASVGNVLSLQGAPTLRIKSTSSEKTANVGQPLDPGDLLKTDQSSTVKLHLIDETILDVGTLSTLLIPRLLDPNSPQRNVLIDVERGKIRAKINRELERAKGRFEIHTNAATLGVEGTDFVIEVTPADASGSVTTRVTVLEGQVAVRLARDADNPAAPHLTLLPGQQFLATARLVGEAIEQDAFREQDIKKLEKAELDDLAKSARLTNETFLQAITLSGSGPGGFGTSTLQAMNRSLRADALPSIRREKSGDALFQKRFRDDQFSENTNFVNLSIGFPP